jgi:hypothetical protein
MHRRARRSAQPLDLMRASVPPKLVEQRIRNRIYEYVASVAEFPENRGVCDLNELVNEWEFYVDDPLNTQQFPAPTFASTEVAAIAHVHSAWLAFADATPRSIDDEAQAMRTPQWLALVEACRKACSEFSVRGKLPEEE